MSICLKYITIENYFDVLNLEHHPNQRNFIASNSISLAEAYVYDKNGDFIAPLAVYDKEVLVGFVMIAYDRKIGISKGNYLLFRFMIDKRFQGLGYFKLTMDAVIDFVRTEPAGKATSLWLSYEPENKHARSCYLHYGFKETGQVIEDEIVAIYDLTTKN